MPSLRLGILTLYLSDNRTLEERTFFRLLSEAGRKIGVRVYIFTPSDVNEEAKRINAHIYNGRVWIRQWIPYPDLFLDRSRFFSSKRYRLISGFRRRNPELTFISSPLDNKWNLYRQLSQKSALRSYLPATTIYRSFDDLRAALRNYRIIYVKPINGSGGRDILRIEKIDGPRYSVRGRHASRRILPERTVRLGQLHTIMRAKYPAGRYIIQEGLDLRLKNGSVHDYRLLIQKNGDGKWEVTGCVGRVGPAGSVTSNLHGGGRAVPMLKLLSNWFGSASRASEVAGNMHKFAYQVADSLESNYGRLCELALDIAVDHKGDIWLLEVNTKPAREVFNRVGDLASYRKAIRLPLEYAKWLHNKRDDDAS